MAKPPSYPAARGGLGGLPPVHPGEVLRETVLPALGLTVERAAFVLGVEDGALGQVVAGQAPVTAALALRLGKLCGNGAPFWLNLQAAYDLRLAEAALGPQLAAIPTLKAAQAA